MAENRRQPTKAERDALRVWFELASAKAGDPIPEHVADIARGICRLALSRSIPAKQAAVQAAAVAGLTGRAIADFRAEQSALLTEMAYAFNRSQPNSDKSVFVAGSITNEVGSRQVYKRLKRLR
jgi:hypothetical protein